MTEQLRRNACVCGHEREAHRHFRSGSDCGLCADGACARFRPEGGVLPDLLRALARLRPGRRPPGGRPRRPDRVEQLATPLTRV